MALYDTNAGTGVNGVNGAVPWYAPKPTTAVNNPVNQMVQMPQVGAYNPINQFVWVTNEGTVDMWPVAAGCEMTFINNEEMVLYVKRVDEYNHPLKVRKFKLTEMTEDEKADSKQGSPAIDMNELKTFISSEVDRAVNGRLSNMFSITTNPAVVKRGEGTDV